MHEINEQISKMCEEFMNEENNACDVKIPSVDFTVVVNSFREYLKHLHDTKEADTIFLDDELVRNLISLKRELFNTLHIFRNIQKLDQQPEDKTKNMKKFATFEELANFILAEEQTLISEFWKLEAIAKFLESFEISEIANDTAEKES
ncbi:CLUMA_CG011916, isoform A [Clunio marinus]|uniref:CLUMA_CG011916, isoform A n=1 Tax=Clunio marinus TaxID=568069 RepID=A0A1J1IEQ1_9DIPT|nr:CLUMA_CG011916, isoform A [Clunio marinus]